MKFYNPKLSMITMGVSIVKGTVQIALAKTLDPNFTGRPEKGQKVYDWEKTIYFSLSAGECFNINEYFKQILEGSYINELEKNEKFKKVFSITHFRNDQPSRLILDRAKDSKGNSLGSIILTLIPPKNEGESISYAFRHNEMVQFKYYIDNGSRYLEFVKDIYEAIERTTLGKARSKANGGKDFKQSNSKLTEDTTPLSSLPSNDIFDDLPNKMNEIQW